RSTVYVVGAGLSAGLGYPLTKNLLLDAWSRLTAESREHLARIIKFHHPGFSEARSTTFPDIEQFLTEVAVNLDLYDASRPGEGVFRKSMLEDARSELLTSIAGWFHELFTPAIATPWAMDLVNRIRRENAAIVSFNWDLILDHLLFSTALNSHSYGLGEKLGKDVVLLKPHGSLNWYPGTEIQRVNDNKRVTIFNSDNAAERIEAFLPPREIKSAKRYTPFIIPPTYLKDFNRPVSRLLWQRCTEVLSTPGRIVFLGYSLPSADLHAQFIFRCGFHNQLEGRLKKSGGRYSPTGPAEVIIVNPDQQAAQRIEAVAGPKVPCTWMPKAVKEWIRDDAGD
ncbi:MAG TPA: hypothetical protein VJT32_02870, partial [bacterium]|nr:hypothetical protein [bacterium]